MFERWRRAGLIVPALMTLIALPILIALGAWQWQRMTWKEDLIAKAKARAYGEPVAYGAALEQFARVGEAEYLKVRVRGVFDHANERHLYAPRPQSQGWTVVTPLRPTDGAPAALVMRGWVPDKLKDADQRSEGQIKGETDVVGLVRAAESMGAFDVAPDTAGNRWYWRDLDGLRASLQPPLTAEASAPFLIEALAEPANPGGWPKGAEPKITIPNRHLEYVLTWWGLAATLLAVFAVFAAKRLRETAP